MRVSLIPTMAGSLGEIQICVLPEDATEARKILSAYRLRAV